jgi:hypothetical protein
LPAPAVAASARAEETGSGSARGERSRAGHVPVHARDGVVGVALVLEVDKAVAFLHLDVLDGAVTRKGCACAHVRREMHRAHTKSTYRLFPPSARVSARNAVARNARRVARRGAGGDASAHKSACGVRLSPHRPEHPRGGSGCPGSRHTRRAWRDPELRATSALLNSFRSAVRGPLCNSRFQLTSFYCSKGRCSTLGK